jgi:hypothetical protein
MSPWNNASVDPPPKDEEEVVVCINGVYYLAVYDAENNCYRRKLQSGESFDPTQATIYWS